jgi:hypothetical protein
MSTTSQNNTQRLLELSVWSRMILSVLDSVSTPLWYSVKNDLYIQVKQFGGSTIISSNTKLNDYDFTSYSKTPRR